MDEFGNYPGNIFYIGDVNEVMDPGQQAEEVEEEEMEHDGNDDNNEGEGGDDDQQEQEEENEDEVDDSLLNQHLDLINNDDNNVNNDQQEEEEEDEVVVVSLEEPDDDDNEEVNFNIKNKKKKRRIIRRVITPATAATSFAKIAIKAEDLFQKIESQTASSSCQLLPLPSTSNPTLTKEERLLQMSKNIFPCVDRVKCPVADCEEEFLYKYDALWHLIWLHLTKVVDINQDETTTTSYSCPISDCNKETNFCGIVEHLCSHLNFRRWACHLCPASFYSHANLRQHIQIVHEPELKVTFVKEVDDEGNLTGKLDKTVSRPKKYTEKKLEISFVNLHQPLIKQEVSAVTKYIENSDKRYILYRGKKRGNFKKVCAIDQCITDPVPSTDLCPHHATKNPEDLRFTTTPPPKIIDLESSPSFYYVLQITNENGEKFNVCANKKCRMIFPRVEQNLNCCTESCLSYLLSPEYNQGGEIETAPIKIDVESRWPYNVIFDQDDPLIQTRYNNNPVTINTIRLFYSQYDESFWSLRCIFDDCQRQQQTRRLCAKHDPMARNEILPDQPLKIKPVGTNLRVNIYNNNNHLSFTQGDVIWIREIWNGATWEISCSVWGCQHSICPRINGLFCKDHGIQARSFFPKCESRKKNAKKASHERKTM